MPLCGRGERLNLGKVRATHRRLGISIAFFLFVQVIAGMLMSVGRLAAVDMSRPYSVLYFIHADWESLGNIYRIVLGLATALQGVLGIIIFRSSKLISIPPPNLLWSFLKSQGQS